MMNVTTAAVDHVLAHRQSSRDPQEQLIVTRHTRGSEVWLTIKHAYHMVCFGDALMNQFHTGDSIYPGVWLENVDHTCDDHIRPSSRRRCFYGSLIHIDARDRHMIYRVCGHAANAGNGVWVARWPD